VATQSDVIAIRTSQATARLDCDRGGNNLLKEA
jgi:hypothetical protein